MDLIVYSNDIIIIIVIIDKYCANGFRFCMMNARSRSRSQGVEKTASFSVHRWREKWSPQCAIHRDLCRVHGRRLIRLGNFENENCLNTHRIWLIHYKWIPDQIRNFQTINLLCNFLTFYIAMFPINFPWQANNLRTILFRPVPSLTRRVVTWSATRGGKLPPSSLTLDHWSL